ncbi:thiol:disulfide interchange protein DsbA/DsbL [Candidatus Pandoraea novymonadis]|nr:thiol:disulfide interchange protein DsbA/DsbL [Candidatus Pandoraea novymonadis]
MKKILGFVLFSLIFVTTTARSVSLTTTEVGTNYTKLSIPQITNSPGKIEVTEFFFYACKHCHLLNPLIDQWAKKQKKDVVVKHIPVTFEARFEPHAIMYYALSALGRDTDLTPKIFNAIHIEKNYLLTAEAQANYLNKFGIDKKNFLNVYNAFSTKNQVNQAKKIAYDYKVDSTPAIVIQGKYLLSPDKTAELLEKTGKYPKNEQELLSAMLYTADVIIRQIREKKL